METFREKMIKMLMYAGVEKEEYADLREEIRQQNEAMLSKGTYLAIVIFLGLFLFSCGTDSIEADRVLYTYVLGGLTLLLATQYVNTRLFSRMILARCYFLMLLGYGYGILTGALAHRGIPTPMFCALLLVVGFLLTDRPWRVCAFQIIMTVVFCVVMYKRKHVDIAAIDVSNAVSFMLLSLLCNTYLIHMKVNNLIHAKNAQREMDTDGLTRLMMKKATEREIRKYISSTRETGALIMIDLDNFKQVNDTKGHAYGDMVLKLTGDSINAVFRRSDILGRFGGDEFIVFLPGMSDRKMIMERLDRFRELMKKGIAGEENANGIGQSIGVAMYPEDAEEYQTLFEKADEALYEAKKRGKNQYCFYTSVKITKSNRQMETQM